MGTIYIHAHTRIIVLRVSSNQSKKSLTQTESMGGKGCGHDTESENAKSSDGGQG